jgi:hypothetical protein
VTGIVIWAKKRRAKLLQMRRETGARDARKSATVA